MVVTSKAPFSWQKRDDLLVHGGVGAVGDEGFGVVETAVGAPHLAGSSG